MQRTTTGSVGSVSTWHHMMKCVQKFLEAVMFSCSFSYISM